MFTIPNQSSVPQAYTLFEESKEQDGMFRMKPGPNRDRIVDCAEEFVKYTLIIRQHFALFGDRFSERTEMTCP